MYQTLQAKQEVFLFSIEVPIQQTCISLSKFTDIHSFFKVIVLTHVSKFMFYCLRDQGP